MAADPLDALRLTLMQEVLPVGMAVVERARRGGPRQVVEAFTGTVDPLGQLRQEGDAAARAVRDSLDQLQPGLGNPVVKVEVRDVPASEATSHPPASDPEGMAAMAGVRVNIHGDPLSERQALLVALGRISERLTLLERRLEA